MKHSIAYVANWPIGAFKLEPDAPKTS